MIYPNHYTLNLNYIPHWINWTWGQREESQEKYSDHTCSIGKQKVHQIGEIISGGD